MARFACRDGDVALAVQNAAEWRRLCTAVLGRPDLAARAEFATNPLRTANRGGARPGLAPAFRALTVAQVIAQLDAASVAWGRLTEVRDLGRHPALRRVEVETDLGARVTLPRPAGRDASFRPGPVPALGARTDARCGGEFGAGQV